MVGEYCTFFSDLCSTATLLINWTQMKNVVEGELQK